MCLCISLPLRIINTQNNTFIQSKSFPLIQHSFSIAEELYIYARRAIIGLANDLKQYTSDFFLWWEEKNVQFHSYRAHTK